MRMGVVDVSKKVIFVTGGANGTGRATVEMALREGASVIAFDIEEDTLADMVDSLEKDGFDAERFMTIAGDVSNASAVANAIKKAVDRFGQLDGVLHAAAIGDPRIPIQDLPEAEYDRVVKICQYGTFNVLKSAITYMRQQKSGSVVCIASPGALRGLPNISGYAAAKWAVRGMVKSVAMEVAPFGIRVNSICPGVVDTRMNDSVHKIINPADPAAGRKWIEDKVPLGRYGTPCEMANTILFLISDASSYITGTDLVIDGAMTVSNGLR